MLYVLARSAARTHAQPPSHTPPAQTVVFQLSMLESGSPLHDARRAAQLAVLHQLVSGETR
jgi:hypothetical protein